MAAVKVGLSPPRVYIFGHRVHHGLFGIVLVLSDLHDWRKWVHDFVCRNTD